MTAPGGGLQAPLADCFATSSDRNPGPKMRFRVLIWTISDSAMLSAAMRSDAVASRQKEQRWRQQTRARRLLSAQPQPRDRPTPRGCSPPSAATLSRPRLRMRKVALAIVPCRAGARSKQSCAAAHADGRNWAIPAAGIAFAYCCFACAGTKLCRWAGLLTARRCESEQAHGRVDRDCCLAWRSDARSQRPVARDRAARPRRLLNGREDPAVSRSRSDRWW